MSSLKDLVKKANEGKATAKKKEDEKKSNSRLREQVKKANENMKSYLTEDEVTKWNNGITDVSQRAYKHLTTEGYKKADTSLAEEIDKYLSESSYISQYLKANKNRFKNYDDIYNSYVEQVNYLKDLQKNLKDSNEYFSKFKTEKEYEDHKIGWLNPEAETTQETASARQERYRQNEASLKKLEEDLPWYAATIMPDWMENWFLSDEDEKRKVEYETLKAENNQYKRLQSALDEYYTPVTPEFTANGAVRNYTNASKEYLQKHNATQRHIESLLSDGNHYYDSNANIINATTKEIDYAADDLTRAMYAAATSSPTNGGFFDTDDSDNYVDQFYNTLVQDKLGMFLSASEDDLTTAYSELSSSPTDAKNTWARILQEGDQNAWKHLTEHELNIYYNLYKTQGQAAAYEYLDKMTTELTRRETLARQKEIDGASGLEQVWLNIKSVPQNVFGGAIGFVEDAANIVRGEDINPYSKAHSFQNDAQYVRQVTAEDINEATGNVALPWVGTTFGDVYQSLMSAADSAVGVAVGGNAYGTLMGMGAASAEMKELWEKGADAGQMVAGGLLAGASEMIFEKYSIDKLVSIGDSKTIKQLIVNGLKQGGVEATEEMFTEIANTITNSIIMGSQSDWVDMGTFVKNVINSGIGGFISGNTMGGVMSAVNYSVNKSKFKKAGADIIKQGGTDTLLNLANEVAGVTRDNTLFKYSDKAAVATQQKAGSKKAALEVGRTSALLQDNITNQNQGEIQSALIEKGLSKKDAKRVSEYLASTEELTEEQIAEVKYNKNIKAVAQELLGDPESKINERTKNLIAARLGVQYKSSNLSDTATDSGEMSVNAEVDVKDKVSADGKTIQASTGEAITINKANAIAKTEVVDGERVVYFNTDNGVVSSKDVSYASEEEGLIYESFVDFNPAFANAVIKNYDGKVPVQTYIKGMREGIVLYGMHNFQGVGKDISKNSFLAELSETDQAFALKLGRAYAESVAKKEGKALRTAIKKASEKAEANKDTSTKATAKKGRVSFEKGVVAKGKLQKRAVSLAKHLSRAIGIDIVFYDSLTTTNKNGEGANGYYDPDTDTIHLDLQNSADDAKTIVFTMSHELVHFIKKWSPDKFNTFAKFLMEQYAEHGVNTSQLLANKMVELKTKDADLAYEEMIADACETMLLDSNAVYKLMELRKTDLELFEKIKLHIYELLNKIRDMYKKLGLQPTSDEAKALLSMKDSLEQIYSLFEDAAVDAAQTYQAVQNANETVFGESSVEVGTTESGVKNQLKNHKNIGEKATAYNDRHKNVHKAILQVGVESMYEMAEAMLPYLEEEGILPPDIPGKTIFKNGSYGRTGENTTLCVRTLTYEDFKDRVAENLGRPLTVSESLLVSQKIYDIATDPQCIYCYVAADRKAYDDYLGEYWKSMDKYIKAMRKGGDSKALYTEYLAGRKDTNDQRKRWSQWEAFAKSGKDYISAKDLTTKRKRDAIIAKKNAFSEQIKDAQRYAQNASWAKTVYDYRAYKGDILRMSSKFVDMLNSEYGLRMYSFSDYTPAFIVENMQMIIDASVKGLKSLAYTKDTDYAEIFASTGQAINVSCFAKWDAESGTFVEDNRQGADWAKTQSLRKQYRNVGAVMVATNDAMVEWALKQDWVDVVIPYHIVKTGTTIANEYQWNNYTSESADKVGNKNATIYPTEHNNDFATYSNLLSERGITPRFSRWYDMVASGKLTESQYMKLVNEVRLPASELSAVVPSFNLEAAKKSFGIDNNGKVIKGGFVDKGGYMGGWYRQGVDVNQEVMAVSEDIKAGKSSLDVDYGMSKAAKEKVEEKYKPSIKKQAKKIKAGMSEAERYSVLKDAKIIAVNDSKSESQPAYIEIEKVPERAKGQVEKLIKDLADDLEILNVPLSTTALNIEFQLSKNNGLRESLSQQLKYGGNFHDFSKALINLRDILNRAILVEAHTEDRYKGTVREDINFEAGYVLFSAFKSQEYVIPVKLEIKQKKDVHNILYVVVSMTKIKRTSVMESAFDDTEVSSIPLSDTDSVYSLPHLVSKINPKDRDFLKYLPDQMLSNEQNAAKRLALKEDKAKLDAIPKKTNSVKKQLKKSPSSYAPTFYSQMGKVVEGIKQEKLGADSVVNFLKGKGIKRDEIKWSGIETFLEGKKSVTKQELLDFINASSLQIGEQMSDVVAIEVISEDGDNYIVRNKETRETLDEWEWSDDVEDGLEGWVNQEGDIALTVNEIEEKSFDEFGSTRWSQYKLDGGSNYRELVFTMPNSSYSNQMMRTHWGEDAEGVLVHARIQDFNVNGKKMLFIEEIQSDWHNQGHKVGYAKNLSQTESKRIAELDKMQATLVEQMQGKYQKGDIDGAMELHKKEQELYVERKKIEGNKDGIPDAPFSNNYHEYVLKRLLRMAAEEGYDSIGWTPAQIQSDRWSDEFAEGYRIEYDQDMPKFLKKYGKQWGATVGSTVLNNGTEVWSMDITEPMEQAVLYEGQAKFQKKRPTNRTILSNALESAIDTSTQEGKNELKLLKDYQAKIDSIEKEEAHLAEVNAEIKELSFGKNTDRSKLKDLKFDKTITQNRIHTYDKQLMKLEAMKPMKDILAREKELVRKRTEEKGREALAEYRRESIKVRNQMIGEARKETRQKISESRQKTEMRHKIRRVVADLRKLLNRGTKERNVKLELQDAVGKALITADILFSNEITNANIVRLGVESVTPAEEKALEKYSKLLDQLDKATDEAEINRIKGQISGLNTRLKELFIRERARLNRETVSNALDALALAYADLKNSTDDYVKNNAYVEGMREKIVNLSNDLQGVTIRDMSYEQLKSVYDMYAMVKHMVQQANGIFREGKYEDLMTNISNVQMELDEISTSSKDPTELKEKIADFLRGFTWNELKPYAAFERLGSQTFQKLFWDVVEADNVWARDIEEAKDVIESARKKYGFKKWDTQKAVTIKSANGLDFKLTLEDMMSIYAYSKRPQAEDHMTTGGFVFDNSSTYKEKGKTYKHKKLSETYRVDPDVIRAVMKELAKVPGAKEYVDEIQAYLTKLGEKGNEVSRVMFGIDLFKEKVYFPLQSAADYRSAVEQTLNATQTMASLKNIGISKETVPHASNPIVLKSFDDVVLNHINQMAKYHAYVVPIENLSKVFNNVNKGSGEYISTQALIASKFGENAKKYFDQFITDLNGGSFGGGASNPLASLFATAKGVSVGANFSVIIQQYFAIIRALDKINPKYFIPFLNGKASKTDGKQYAEMKKYAPVAIIKEIGGFDMGANKSALTYMGDAETRLTVKKADRKTKDLAMALPGLMDKLGWCTIWRAVKKEIADTTDLKVGTEEFYQACGKRFTEIVATTQVYDSVTSRSGYMRSKHESVKYLTSFMGEPTAIVNQMFTKQLELARAIKSKDKARLKKASAGMARTSAVIILSTVLTNLAKSLPYAMRDDDEEEKSLLERWAKHFGEATASDMNPLNMLPIGRDLVSIWEGWDIDRPDTTLISDLFTSFKKAIDDGCTLDEALNFAGAFANISGYPLKNVIRDVKGFVRLFGDITDDIKPTDIGGAFGEGFMGEDKAKTDKLYDAMVNGDTAKIEVLKSTYKDDKAYEQAIRKALRENDPRIKEAAKARFDGDMTRYKDIAYQIKGEGHFTQDNIVAAIMTEYNALKSATSEESSDSKSPAMYNYTDYYNAIINGDSDDIAVVKDYLIESGKTENNIESNLNSKVKEAYEEGKLSDSEAKSLMVSYGGKTEDEADIAIRYVDFKAEYPDYKDVITEARFANYYEPMKDYYGRSVADTGLSISAYAEYCEKSAECKGTDANGDGKTDSGSKKAQVLRVINSLPISSAQKDALYYLNGWAKSKLYSEAPWH